MSDFKLFLRELRFMWADDVKARMLIKTIGMGFIIIGLVFYLGRWSVQI